MSTINTFDRTKHLDELDSPLWTNEGVLTPAVRRSRMRANLDVPSTDEVTTAAAAVNNAVVVVPAAGGAVDLSAIPNGGKVLIPLVTANVTVTLPTPVDVAGKTYEFIFGAGATADAEDWVITSPVAYVGGLVWQTSGTPDIELVAAATTIMTINNPNAGTKVMVTSNGTTWVVHGVVMSANTPAFS